MIKINIKYYLWLIIILGLFISISVYYVCGYNTEELSVSIVFRIISTSVTILTIISAFFVSKAWKWQIFHDWLVPIPNLNGEWQGTLKSDYKDAKEPIPTKLFIKQNFFHTSVILHTGESKSRNMIATFDIDFDRNRKQLIYTYLNTPKATIQKRSAIHYGTTILDISNDNKTLEGIYWTTRKTQGDIKLTRI